MKKSANPEEIEKFRRLADSWWDNNGPLKTLHDINPARLDFIKKHTPLTHKSVLDVGCGGGILSLSLAKEGAKVTAIDACEEAIEIAKQEAEKQNLKVTFKTCLLEDLKPSTFDIITCLEMLEHVDDPQGIISACAKHLAPGGKLFLSTINRSIKAYLEAIVGAEYLLKILPKQTHDYEKFIKPSELARILRPLGFEKIQFVGLDYNPFSRQTRLREDISVNYLLVCEKSIND